MDKIAVYKMKRRGSVTPTCKTFVSFNYKAPGGSSVTFQYIECGGITNTVTYVLPPSDIFTTYLIADSLSGEFCFEEGTLVRVSGLLSINTFVYGTCTV